MRKTGVHTFLNISCFLPLFLFGSYSGLFLVGGKRSSNRYEYELWISLFPWNHLQAGRKQTVVFDKEGSGGCFPVPKLSGISSSTLCGTLLPVISSSELQCIYCVSFVIFLKKLGGVSSQVSSMCSFTLKTFQRAYPPAHSKLSVFPILVYRTKS